MTIKAGAVSIEVEPDITGFAQKAKTLVQMATQKLNAEVEINPDLSGFREQLRAKLIPAMALMGQKLKVDTESVNASVNKLKTSFSNLGNAIKSIPANIGSLFKFIKFPVIISFLGSIAGGFAALVAGAAAMASSLVYASGAAVSLAAALAPLAGLLVAYPGILLAVASGMGVVMLATQGMGEAIKAQTAAQDRWVKNWSMLDAQQKQALNATAGMTKGTEEYNAAYGKLSASQQAYLDMWPPMNQATADYLALLKEMPPAQAKFIEALPPFIKEMETLKEVAAGGLFGQLLPEMDSLKKLFPLVEGYVNTIANDMGQIGANAIKMVTSTSWIKDMETVAGTNHAMLVNLGKAALAVADGFRHIYLAAQPLVLWLGEVFAEMGTNFSVWASTARESGVLAGFFEKTMKVAKILGPALFDLGHALFGILKAAAPAGQSMIRSFAQWAKWLDHIVSSTKGQNSLKKFFQEAKDTATLVWKPIKNLAMIIGEILKIAKPMGDGLWKSFGKGTESLLKLVQSVKGQNAIKKFFEEAKPVLSEVGKLIKAFAEGFADLATDSNIAGLIKTFRKDLLPTIIEIAHSASGKVGPLILELADAFLKLFNTFGTESGVTVMLLETIVKMADGLVKLLDNNPELKKFVVTFAALAMVGKQLGVGELMKFKIALGQVIVQKKLLTAIEKLNGEVTKKSMTARIGLWVKEKAAIVLRIAKEKAMLAMQKGGEALKAIAGRIGAWIKEGAQIVARGAKEAAMWVASTAKLLIHKGVVIATSAAVKIWAAAQWILNAALNANPIGLIIIAITALVAGLVWVATKTKFFQKAWEVVGPIVMAVWDGIKNAAMAFWNWIQPIAKVVIGAIIMYFKIYWEVVKAVWKGIMAAAKVAWNVIKGVWKAVKPFFTALWNGIKAVVMGVWKAIGAYIKMYWGIIKAVWNGAKAFFGALFRGVASIIKGVWDGVKKFFGPVVEWMSDKIKWLVDKIKGAVQWIIGLIDKGKQILGLEDGVSAADENEKAFVKKMTPIWIAKLSDGDKSNDATYLRNLREAGVPGYATGGIATHKQLAWVAEKEPEAIIPLSKLSSMATGGFPGAKKMGHSTGGLPSSGKLEIVITNPDKMRGYAKRIATTALDGGNA